MAPFFGELYSILAAFCLKYAGMWPKVSYLAFSLNCLLEAVLKCTFELSLPSITSQKCAGKC